MLKRSKSNRSQRTNRRNSTHGGTSVSTSKTAQLRLEVVDDKRCSDDDSSQSSLTGAPVFASVHRPRHVGIKRNENNAATGNSQATTNGGNTAAITMQQPSTGNNATMQRPSYQKYQQQRRIQFQQQQQLQQQQQQQHALQKQIHLQQQPYQIVSVGNAHMNDHQQKQQLQLQQQQKLQKPKGAILYEMQLQQQVTNHGHYLPNGMINTNAVSNRLSIGHIQQKQQEQQPAQHSNKSHIPVHNQKMPIPQQQQQQQQHQFAFNQISKNATNLLNDIYERNLLSQTTFVDTGLQQQIHYQQQQQQQQQLQQKSLSRAQVPLPPNLQNSSHIWLHKPTKAQIHSMKLPPPPLPPQTEQQQQQQLRLTDAYVDPVDTKKHFLFDAHNHQPPPPPAPLNHVYETIKERPPMPPPPPERNQNSNQLPPPLPPSRLLKKKLMAAAAANNHGTNSRPHKSHKKSYHDKDGEKKAHNKMLHMQPPAYIAPPPLLANAACKTPAQFSYCLQQRTKADGEHRSILYQQLREQNLKQQQQQMQQNKIVAANEVNEKEQQQQQQQVERVGNKHLNTKQQLQQQQQPQQREHPLGAHDEKPPNVASATMQHNNNSSNNATIPTEYSTCMIDCENMPLDEHDAPLSVEHTLQQAGLLPTSSTSSTSASLSNNNLNSSNNNNNSNVNGNGSGSGNNNNRHNRPSALPIVFEEDTGEFQDVLVLEQDGTAKLPYRHGKKIEVSLETAQAMAAAAYYAR